MCKEKAQLNLEHRRWSLQCVAQRFDSNSEVTALQAKERPYLVLQDLDTERVQNFF